MRKSSRMMLCMAALCGIAVLPVIASAQATITKKATKPAAKPTITSSEAKLPEAVKKTFDAKFPNAKIESAESEKEGGVMVWDIEFRDGRKHMETDIADNGTLIESSEQVTQKSVP